MGRFHHILSVIAAVALVAAPVAALAKPQDYGFVQSVGGLRLKNPVRSNRGWELPVEINVAGLKAVTVQPTLIGSGLACEKISARVDGDTISLQVHVALARAGQSANCPPAQLGNIAAGDYRVFYEANKRDSLNSGPAQPATEIGRVNIIATNNNLY